MSRRSVQFRLAFPSLPSEDLLDESLKKEVKNIERAFRGR